jgi:hypothetical protein
MPYRGQRRRYNPYAGSGGRLSDLMLAQGEQQANLAREQGDIWGQFLQNVGQTAGDTLQAYQQDERERPERERRERLDELGLDAAEASARQAAKKAREAMILENQAANLVFREYKDGTYGVENFPEQLEGLRAAGLGHLAKDMIENYGSMHEATVTYRKSLKTALGHTMKGVADGDFDGMSLALAYAVKNEMLREEDAENILRDIRENPERIAVIRNGFINEAGLEVHGDPVTLAPGDILTRPAPGGTFEEVARGGKQPAKMQTIGKGNVALFLDPETGLPQLAEDGTPIVFYGPKDTPTATSQLTSTMSGRQQYQKETGAAGFILNQVGQMKRALEQVKRGELFAGSQPIITIFNKILDPTSVVRESEYNRTLEGQPILQQMQGWWDQNFGRGGAGVTAENLEAYVNMAETLAQGNKEYISATRENWRRIANDYGLNSAHIIGDDPNWEQMTEGGAARPPVAFDTDGNPL